LSSVSQSSFPPVVLAPVPPFPPRGPSGRFPRFIGTIEALRLPAARPTSLRFLRSVVPAPTRSGRETTGSPRFLRVPLVYMPCSTTPVGPRAGPIQHDDVAFRLCNGVGSHIFVISGLNNTACTLAVYASQPGSPLDHARLASGWWPALTGRAARSSRPAGTLREVSALNSSHPPHPGFSWRTANPSLHGSSAR
jgi:hypothetical protein